MLYQIHKKHWGKERTEISHCNIYISRAWSCGSGWNSSSWKGRRQRRNIRRILWDSHKNSCCLAGEGPPLGHIFPNTFYLLVIVLSLTVPRVVTTYGAPRHEMHPGGCQDVYSTLATDVGWEMPCGEPIDICTCVSNLMIVWKITWVSKAYQSARSVNAICCATERITNPPLAARFWLYLRNTPQVVQERWRRCLGSR